jgi:hypothetical protein
LEKFQQKVLQQAYRAKNPRYPVFLALRATGTCPAWTDRTPRDCISAQSNALADRTGRVVEQTMPAHLVSDPAFELGTSPELDQIVVQMKQKGGVKATEKATILLKDLLEPLPSYMCSYVRSVLKK